MKKILALVLSLMLVLGAVSATAEVTYKSQPAFVGNEDEVYYFVSWFAGNEWWVGGYEGFKDAARQLGVKTVCTGAVDDGIDNQMSVLQQVIAMQPAGICLAVSDGAAFGDATQEALNAGIPVATTDNPIDEANTIMFMGYNDVYQTRLAADHIGKTAGADSKVALLEVVGQLNLEKRAAAFREQVATYWPEMEIVGSANSGHDELKAAADTAALLLTNPDLDFIFSLNATAAMGAVTAIQEAGSDCRVITMDVNENVLDYIKEGKIDAAIMPDSYTFGYISMLSLYCEAHDLLDPMWKIEDGVKSGWHLPYVEVGATVVTADTADGYYTSKYYESRGSKGFDEGAQDMTATTLPGYWER